MLTFDPSFHSDGGCVVWADETLMGRVRFDIGANILEDALHGGRGCVRMLTWHSAKRSGPASRPRADKRSLTGQVRT
jgi:hypothetical protein